MKPIQVVESITNEHFRRLQKLSSGAGIKKAKEALISGEKIILDFLNKKSLRQSFDDTAFQWILTPEHVTQPCVKNFDFPLRPLVFSQKLFGELDIFNTRFPILSIKTPELALPSAAPVSQISDVELWIAMSDPANLGALLRSAHAFQVKSVVLLKECALPFHPKAIRASSGCALWMDYTVGPSLQDVIDQSERPFVALDLQGELIQDFKWPKSFRLLLGEEGQGLPKGLAVKRVMIRTSSEVESLNATVAASIALFHYSTQQKF